MSLGEDRVIDIEIALANCEKTIEELNVVVIEQGKMIDALVKQHKKLIEMMSEEGVKPLSEEVPPPHY